LTFPLPDRLWEANDDHQGSGSKNNGGKQT
jgi:hypothetical protein